MSTLFEIEAAQTGSRRTCRDRSRVARTLPNGPRRLRHARAPGSPALAAQLARSEREELIAHDGHAPGHTAFWLPPLRVLIAGDMLSDVELPLPFYLDDLPSYIDDVVSGGASEDHRIANPGMEESHAHLMRMARSA